MEDAFSVPAVMGVPSSGPPAEGSSSVQAGVTGPAVGAAYTTDWGAQQTAVAHDVSWAPAGAAPLATVAPPCAMAGVYGDEMTRALTNSATTATADAALAPGNANNLGDPVADFARHWDLDWNAVQWLLALEEPVRATVLAEFSPRCESRDVVKMLYAFGQSVASRHAANATMSDELRTFTQRWGLDGPTVGWLLGLAEPVRAVLLREFAPREGTGDAAAKLRAFARSVEARFLAAPAELAQQCAVAPPDGSYCANGGYAYGHDPRYEEFVAYWGLEENSRSLLLALPLDVQATVIDQFNPRGEAVNVNGKFIAFARSVAAGKEASDTVEGFSAHWGLDLDTKEFVRGLAPELRAAVITRFDPAPGTRDMNSKLRAFTRSIEKTLGFGANGHAWPHAYSAPQPAVQWHSHQAGAGRPPGMAPLAVAPWGAAPPATASTAAFHSGTVSGGDEDAFLAKWNFAPASGAREILHGLPPEVRARVIHEFAPAPSTRDVFRLFAGFASSVARGLWGAGARQRQPPLASGALQPGPEAVPQLAPPHDFNAQYGASHGSGPGAGPPESEEDFVQRWQLDEGSKALLRGLPDDIRSVVMAEFNPRPPIYDIGGKFCAFARSVASRQTAGGEPRGLKRAAGE